MCLMYESFVNIFDSKKAFWDYPKKSTVSDIGVYTIVHYGVSRKPLANIIVFHHSYETI